MTQRQAKFWVWWLLPFLAARALVPAGFMTDVASGTFRLVMCSEVTKISTSLPVGSIQAKTALPDNPGHSRSTSVTHALCSFAGSATAVFTTVSDGFAFQRENYTAAVPTTAFPIVYCENGANSIRGPPLFS